jgi:MFS superfamily sulfate permease-like transporter
MKFKKSNKTTEETNLRQQIRGILADAVPLFVLIAAALLIFLGPSSLERRIPTVESIPGTHATLRFPTFRMGSAVQLAYGFVAVALVDFVVSYGVTKQYAPKDDPPDADSELRAFGVSSLVSSALGGMPVQASLSRTAVNAENANTPLAALLAAAVIVLMTQVAASLFSYVPLASIASIVVLAARKLFDHKTFNALRADPARRGELYEWLVAFLGSVCFSLVFGVAAAIIFSAARHFSDSSNTAALPANTTATTEAADDKKDEIIAPAASTTTVKDTAMV